MDSLSISIEKLQQKAKAIGELDSKFASELQDPESLRGMFTRLYMFRVMQDKLFYLINCIGYAVLYTVALLLRPQVEPFLRA